MTLIMMIKALLALALTVNLAASITCYSGMQFICPYPCHSYTDMVSVDSDACTTELCGNSYTWNPDSSTWDTCMSFTYSYTSEDGCACDMLMSLFWASSGDITSSVSFNTDDEPGYRVYEGVSGCPYWEMTSTGTMVTDDGETSITDGTWTCTACMTDNCNQDATQDATEVSGAGSLYASRTLACLSSFAVALLLCRLF